MSGREIFLEYTRTMADGERKVGTPDSPLALCLWRSGRVTLANLVISISEVFSNGKDDEYLHQNIDFKPDVPKSRLPKLKFFEVLSRPIKGPVYSDRVTRIDDFDEGE